MRICGPFAALVVVSTHWGVSAAALLAAEAEAQAVSTFVDCSLPADASYPCTWPAYPFPRFHLIHQRRPGPDCAVHVDTLLMDGNVATQMDVPPHSVARPDLNRPKSGPFGLAYTDKIEAWQFGGEACVIDVSELLDQAPKGVSPLITPAILTRFEQQRRPLKFGDVALFRSGYSNRYYRPFPEGNRFLKDVLDRQAPGFPDPDPDCMEALGQRGVLTAGVDSPSMGPVPDLAEPTHYAGLKYGMIWTEGATNLHELPETGAFYCMLSPKHAGGPYGECRAFAIVGGDLPQRLIDACRNKRAVDLSPTLASNLPVVSPGVGAGEHRQTYLKVDFLYSEYLDMWHHTHLMDSMVGTHLVPPAFALPADETPVPYAPEVRGWLVEYEQKYGRRGRSARTAEQVPIEWTCGPARVVDVRGLVGTTERRQWPMSPEITPALLEKFEAENGPLKPGEIVIFCTGHLDRYFRPQPDDQGVWSEPLNGKSEGWPAPGPDAIVYLQKRGIRCVATDAPDLGGVDPRRALMTYWALGSRDMVGVEFLHQVDKIPAGGYFLFAASKIVGCHGGPGRAIVLY